METSRGSRDVELRSTPRPRRGEESRRPGHSVDDRSRRYPTKRPSTKKTPPRGAKKLRRITTTLPAAGLNEAELADAEDDGAPAAKDVIVFGVGAAALSSASIAWAGVFQETRHPGLAVSAVCLAGCWAVFATRAKEVLLKEP